MARLPDLLVVYGEWRIARFLRATLQCDPQLLNSFFDLLFQSEPELGTWAKKNVFVDNIYGTREVRSKKYDLCIGFSADGFRTSSPGIRFNKINVELKDEAKAHQEQKGEQILTYIKEAEVERALVGYIRLDNDPLLGSQYINRIKAVQHPRYLCPDSNAPNFTWADVIGALFKVDDDLRKCWVRAVQVFCEKKVEWTPTFGKIRKAAKKVLSLERLPLSRETLSAYVNAVCDVYSIDICDFQRKYLKFAIERATKRRAVRSNVIEAKEKNYHYSAATIELPRRSVYLKWSEALPVQRAPQVITDVLRAPCSWIDPGDGYSPKPEGDWREVSGTPVFPFLSYKTIDAFAEAVVAAIW